MWLKKTFYETIKTGTLAPWTEALPKAELERKLHEAVILARARLEGRMSEQGPAGSGGEESRFIKESRAVYRTTRKR